MNEMMTNRHRDQAMRLPRIGFLGVGWIGRNRMEAILETGLVEAAAICDASDDMAGEALAMAPQAKRAESFEALLESGIDGVVIATPSALHADQSIRALDAGLAVFCQKPLGRTRQEVEAVVDAARRADRLLGVDLSYRRTAGMERLRQLIRDGALGRVHAVDLVFHNAYGPDKPWFYDKRLSGGGCVMDLGVHLVDLALWALDFPEVDRIESSLFGEGRLLCANADAVEDYAVATLHLRSGAVVRLACSWRLHAGRDAEISASFYGKDGGASFRNVDGSFYDFTAEHYRGTDAERLTSPPDAWGGRMAADWARRLADGAGFDAENKRLIDVAAVLDGIYRR